jgi:hypothetical protein
MSNKANNLAIVAQIKTLLEGMKLEGDAGHDAVMFFYNDRTDHEDAPDDMTVQGTVVGCPCTLAYSLDDMARHHQPMRDADIAREMLHNPLARIFGGAVVVSVKKQPLHKEEPKPAADETTKATTDGNH